MRYDLNSSCICGCVVLALAAPAAAIPAAAEEAGQWFGRAVLVTLSSKSVKVEDRADHTVSVTEFDGAVFNADGKPFLDKARYQVVDLTDAGTSSGGHKTFTEADGSKVFAKYVLKDAKPKEFRGTFEFTGGTGKYAGITGRGEYHVVQVSDTALWDELRGEYKIPAPTTGSAAPPR
ncbi:hypothetical protein GWE18_14970 [Bradyrhizobium sp. CSA112]|uniref:hypothetical protein n=1 Tax=Bradyrhizobium sp. CSA112 TaxID=2699170 RepID=UPI0023B1265E|nr:hypothetical protein [Bradyrhizobium sp. CSA112]MDE5454129.1 hypothetical protein [Bradyrhizobium sp. CSA112]